MNKFLVIALGGGIGAVLRYLFSGWIYKFTPGIFPWGTLGVNVAGCFTAGLLWEIFDRTILPANLKLFVFIGILGGFTTFSTFGLESFNLLRDGEIRLSVLNILASNILCLLGVYAGMVISRLLLGTIR